MKSAGVALIIVGVMLVLGALIYQPTVETDGAYGLPQETYNLGLLQYQLMFFQGGLGLVVAGSVMASVGALLERFEQSGLLKPVVAAATPASGTTTATAARSECDWCDRQLPAGYRTCVSFSPERLAEVSEKVRDPVCKAQLSERGYKIDPGDIA